MKEIKLTKEQITQIVAVVFFGGILGYFYIAYFWMPLSKNIAEKTKKIESLDRQVQNAKRKKAKFKDLEAKLAKLKEEKKEAQKKLPKGKELPDLIRKLMNLSKKHNVEIMSISPSASKKERYFTKIQYAISAKADYHDMGRFLAEIALQERIFTIENLKINAAGGKDYSSRFNFSLVTYQYGS